MSDGPPQEAAELPNEDWLVTYADAITLLMAFFVLMFSVSEPNTEKFESVTAGIVESLSRETVPSPFKDIREELSSAVTEGEGQSDSVSSTNRGVTQEFKGGKIFGPGAAIVLPEAEPLLDRVAQLVTLLGNSNYRVEVEGHTDDTPISTAQFPSNWELSAQRASAVVRFLISRGVRADRMVAIGYADTRPKVPHQDDDGNPIIENRETNRRIVIKIER